MPSIQTQYDALTRGTGLGDHRRRTQVEITGTDRTTFLHGFCTNDVKRLVPGGGCEAFLTNVQGKVIGFVNLFCQEESLVLETAPGQADSIIAALDRYLIREDVQLVDRGGDWNELLVCGAESEALLESTLERAAPAIPMSHIRARLADVAVSVRRVRYAGDTCFFLSCQAGDYAACRQRLVDAGAVACEQEAVDIARIETGTPNYAVDITDDNLPQEVDRDDAAISFTKGCYLGQETVARIDAMGHVNRTLRGLKFSGSDIPVAGTKITRDGKTMATVTSACWSYRLDAPLALGYVRREVQTGTRLATDDREVEVVSLPV